MNPTPTLGLPPAIDAAVRRVKQAARAAAERTVDSLGVSALASANVFQRDALLGAQFELSRKLAAFCNGFDDTLDRRIESELLPRASTQAALDAAGWDALSLVDNQEMELQVSAERFGLQIAHDCEAEQRELEGFVGSVLQGFGEAPRNPLRPEIIGNAIIRSIERLTDRPEQRKVLVAEFGRSLAAALPQTYAAIVAELRAAGVKPALPSFRNSERGGGGFARSGSGHDTTSRPVGLDEANGMAHRGARGMAGSRSAHGRGADGGRASGRGSSPGTPIGQVDAGLMTLIRRLAFSDGGDGSAGGDDGGHAGDPAFAASAPGGFGDGGARSAPVAPNLIRARREALREALARIGQNAEGFDETRIAQELALMAVRADVTEETDRLGAHIQAAGALLADSAPVGRKFDFLMQEFLREANTLLSKSQDRDLTRIGLDLKTVIDQMREQVQNVE